MKMSSSKNTIRGVSPVVAVILMVAITVILSAVIGTFVLDLGQSVATDSGRDIGVQVSPSGDSVTVRVITGSADEVRLLVNGSVVENASPASAGVELTANATPDSTITVVAVTDGSTEVVSSSNPLDSATSSGGIPGPTDSLIAYYEYDSGSGSTAVDSINSRDGQLFGTYSWTSNNSKVGSYALSFSDSSNATYGSNVSENSFSVFMWVKPTPSPDYERFLSNFDANTGLSVEKHQTDGVLHTVIKVSGTGYSIDGSTNLTGSYHHVGITYDGEVFRAYVDGQLIGENSSMSGSIDNGGNLYTGRDPAGVSYVSAYEGVLDDVRLYNKSLSKQEVSDLYNATK